MTRRRVRGHPARKALGAYYTPATLVEAALAWLPQPRGAVVDLACGAGAWLEAAGRRWSGAQLVGIDIEPGAISAARQRLGSAAELLQGDGLRPPGRYEVVIGNPPWGAGRVGAVRRGHESVSRFIDAALEHLVVGGRLCLLVPAAWLEVAAHRGARGRLLATAAIERIEHLGDVFAGVHAPAALLIARREPDARARTCQSIATPYGALAQAEVMRDAELVLNARLAPPERALMARLQAERERLFGRVRFILGVVTGNNRRALGHDGEPIVSGTDVAPMHITAPRRRLAVPLDRVQQAAPRTAYARDKVVYRFVSSHPVAAVDRAGRLTLNSANAFAVDDPALELDFVAAWLNSSTVRWLHRAGHALPRVLRSHLERLPLPPTTASERVAISAAALAGDAARLDTLMMDAYRLDDDERRLVGTCRPF